MTTEERREVVRIYLFYNDNEIVALSLQRFLKG